MHWQRPASSGDPLDSGNDTFSPIIGARKLSQLEDNLASFELTLSSDQVKTIDEASKIELGFPYDLYGKELPRTFMYGGMEKQILA